MRYTFTGAAAAHTDVQISTTGLNSTTTYVVKLLTNSLDVVTQKAGAPVPTLSDPPAWVGPNPFHCMSFGSYLGDYTQGTQGAPKTFLLGTRIPDSNPAEILGPNDIYNDHYVSIPPDSASPIAYVNEPGLASICLWDKITNDTNGGGGTNTGNEAPLVII